MIKKYIKPKYWIILLFLFAAIKSDAQNNFPVSWHKSESSKKNKGIFIKDDSANHNIEVYVGKIERGDKAFFYFDIENISNKPLIFTSVGWGEPFTVPICYPKKPTKPDKNVHIKYQCLNIEKIICFVKTSHIITDLGTLDIIFTREIK